MKLLVLGGTLFLGRHLVEAALARGHEVTLFNRGTTNPELFPQVEKLRGDRDGNLAALTGRQWDAALDVAGYVPRLVRASAALLADAVRHYTFISTISVYADYKVRGIGEDAPVGRLDDETVEEVTGGTYGPLKALCEGAAEAALPGRVLTIRPGLIVGPHDPTDRFTYWPYRVAQGGDVLAPGRPERPVQFVDARDLAEWNLRMAASRRAGVYNATGPDDELTMGRLLEECKAVSGSDARFVWVDEAFLLEREVGPWMELPLWIPETQTEMAGFMRVSCKRAIADGLTFRPLSETIQATLDWNAARPELRLAERDYGVPLPRAGMKPERERELLEAWRTRA